MKKLDTSLIVDNKVCIFKDSTNHNYWLIPTDDPDDIVDNYEKTSQLIKFQLGPIKEAGLNGISEASLIQILIDRFEYFQNGDLPCNENNCILDNLYHILFKINKRTKDRIARNVKGYSKK